MPLDRLLQYLEQIAAVVGPGMPEEMHLIRIDESSTKPIFKMHRQAAQQARERAEAVRTGRGTARQRVGYDNLRRMVRKDGGKPATLTDRTGILLHIPPAAEESEVVASVRQATTFDGALLKVGGVGDYTAIQMQDLGGEVHSGFSAPKAMAKSMGRHLFDPLRVIVIGNWDRHRVGGWKLSRMLIQAYEPLADDSLETVLSKLRSAPVQWPPNADALLDAERESTP